MLDLFGQAILDFQTNNNPEDLITETSISDEDEMSVAYLFRDFESMPKLEQVALNLSFGNVLDVGCGAGSHSLYLEKNKKLTVLPIDISKKAIQACHLRGLVSAKAMDILDLENKKFETILVLMNGTGIFKNLLQTAIYLQKLRSLLSDNGQILIDSSDIIYMYDDAEDEDAEGSKWIPTNGYYGELTFKVSYKNQTEVPFEWLFLDFNTFQNAANANGLLCELVQEGEHFDYLARLTLLKE
jgi:SAM-dependent methyltransferase